MIEKTRNLVEPAGAAPLAAVLSDPGRFAGRNVTLICTGGNISPAQLVSLWTGKGEAGKGEAGKGEAGKGEAGKGERS
jgi:threonine dehydratase